MTDTVPRTYPAPRGKCLFGPPDEYATWRDRDGLNEVILQSRMVEEKASADLMEEFACPLPPDHHLDTMAAGRELSDYMSGLMEQKRGSDDDISTDLVNERLAVVDTAILLLVGPRGGRLDDLRGRSSCSTVTAISSRGRATARTRFRRERGRTAAPIISVTENGINRTVTEDIEIGDHELLPRAVPPAAAPSIPRRMIARDFTAPEVDKPKITELCARMIDDLNRVASRTSRSTGARSSRARA